MIFFDGWKIWGGGKMDKFGFDYSIINSSKLKQVVHDLFIVWQHVASSYLLYIYISIDIIFNHFNQSSSITLPCSKQSQK